MLAHPTSLSSHSNKTASTSATADTMPNNNNNSKNAATATTSTSSKSPRFGFGKSKSSKKINGDTDKKKASTNKSSNPLVKLPKLLLSSSKYPKPKIVKESIPVLEEELHVLTQDAPLLDTTGMCENMCFLDRKEVLVGDLLGEGQFARVYHVTELSLRAEEKLASTATLVNLSPDDHGKREVFVQDFNACQQAQEVQLLSSSSSSHNHNHANHCHKYAIKHLKRDLLISPTTRRRKRNHKRYGACAKASPTGGGTASDLPLEQQFQLAAADLVVEAMYLSRLRHPHVISIRGMAAGGASAFANGRYDSFFLILDKLSGTLHERIRHWRNTPGQPRESLLPTKTYYAYQMALALEYLHKRRIIFRDLKPSNAGFKEGYDDQLQIFDFGLCRELPKSSLDDPNEVYFMTAAGTHRYMAVEILQGKKYSLKADTYSFAMVFYEMLAQEAPFSKFDEADLEMLVCERKHRPHHFFGCVVPQSIQKLLGDAWEHEIDDRITMSQVVTRLEDILATTFHQRLRENAIGVKVMEDTTGSGEEKAPTTPSVVAA